MPTPQEMYDVERKKKVKDLPLLKTLKETIDALIVLSGQLQQAEAQENWDEYESVQQLITLLNSNHNSNTTTTSTSLTCNSDDDFEPTLNNGVGILPSERNNALGSLPLAAINCDDAFEPTGNDTVGILQLETINSDDDFEPTVNKSVGTLPTESINSDDDFEPMDTISVHQHQSALNVHIGDTFASVQDLQHRLSTHTQKHNFKIRCVKDCIVCYRLLEYVHTVVCLSKCGNLSWF
jgi:hypothetical protein